MPTAYRLIPVLLALTLMTGVCAQSLIPATATSSILANGLQVVVYPTDTQDVVALQIVMRVGSRNEVEAGKSGFAHFFEHLMFRGTDRYPPAVADSVLKKAGVDSNAWTSLDQTVYHKVFLKEDLATILDYEADRFMHLKFAEPEFRTEALAVLGEYNKNSTNPVRKMGELMQDTAFTQHTYKHTTMGFLADIENFPEGFDYAWTFFERFYSPEYATIILVGDVNPQAATKLVTEKFGSWKAGSYKSLISSEPPQTQPREATITWNSPTLPWLMVGYKSPANADIKATVALQVWEALAFSPTSKLYQKLVLNDRVVDEFSPRFPRQRDPYLTGITVRVTDPAKLDIVRAQILAAFETLGKDDISPSDLAAVKDHLRYSFLQELSSPSGIADNLAYLLSLNPDLHSIDQYYDAMASVSVRDLKAVARTVFRPEGRTIITLTSKESPN